MNLRVSVSGGVGDKNNERGGREAKSESKVVFGDYSRRPVGRVRLEDKGEGYVVPLVIGSP